MGRPPSHRWPKVSFTRLFREVMAAPNVLQAGITENIFVEIQDCAFETDVVVNLIVMNHPTKNVQLLSTAVTLNSSNSYQAFGEILVMWKW